MDNGYLELVDAIKTLNQQTLKKWDQTTLCEIVQKNNDGTYNIRMLSDEGQNGTVIQNVKNGSKYKYKELNTETQIHEHPVPNSIDHNRQKAKTAKCPPTDEWIK